jgi:hypothetical protein
MYIFQTVDGWRMAILRGPYIHIESVNCFDLFVILNLVNPWLLLDLYKCGGLPWPQTLSVSRTPTSVSFDKSLMLSMASQYPFLANLIKTRFILILSLPKYSLRLNSQWPWDLMLAVSPRWPRIHFTDFFHKIFIKGKRSVHWPKYNNSWYYIETFGFSSFFHTDYLCVIYHEIQMSSFALKCLPKTYLC